MPNSRLGIETRAITEGALMAVLTAVLALAGIYIPLLEIVVMLVWTLPVVVVCMRHGMRAGAVTMAVAGLIIMMISTPMVAFDMVLRSAGAALLIGNGFRHRWRTEKTLLYTAIAAFAGMVLNLLVTTMVMGISIMDMFIVDTETVNEMVALFADYGLLDSFGASAEEMANTIHSMFSTMRLIFPGALLVYGLMSAVSNYLAADFVLRKLKIPTPPVTKLSTLRLPSLMIFGFLLGFGMTILGFSLWPQEPMVVTVGQNITVVFMALYMFQGLGMLLFFINKTQPGTKGFLKFVLIASVFMTFFGILSIIAYIGIADAIFDFRKIEVMPIETKEE